MKLAVTERMVLINVLPQEGDVVTLKVIRDLQSALGFSEEEIAELDHGTVDGKIGKDVDEKVPSKEVSIGAKAFEIITGALRRLSDSGELHISWLPVYERFCEADLQLVESVEGVG